jgi:hypothetical protein
MLIPDLDDLDSVAAWQLDDLLKRLGRPGVVWLSASLAARAAMEQDGGDRRVGGVGLQRRPSRYVAPVTEADVQDELAVEAVSSLVGLANDSGSVAYYLADMLGEVDPKGLIVPAAVVAQIAAVERPQDLVRLARLARAYAVGSIPWRTIASPVLANVATAPDDKRRGLYEALAEAGVRSWSGAVGQVPEIFRTSVVLAKEALASEADEPFRSLWAWRLGIAEAQLKQQEEECKEERGE